MTGHFNHQCIYILKIKREIKSKFKYANALNNFQKYIHSLFIHVPSLLSMKTKMTSSHQPHQHINSTRESIPQAHDHHDTLSRQLNDTGTSITLSKKCPIFH